MSTLDERRESFQLSLARAKAGIAQLEQEEFGVDGKPDEPMEEHKPLSRALLDYPSLLSLNLPEQKRHLPILPEGGSAMVYGLRGIGKTFFKLGLTASLTTGQDFLGWKVTAPCGVLYIDGEMRIQELKSRITARVCLFILVMGFIDGEFYIFVERTSYKFRTAK